MGGAEAYTTPNQLVPPKGFGRIPLPTFCQPIQSSLKAVSTPG